MGKRHATRRMGGCPAYGAADILKLDFSRPFTSFAGHVWRCLAVARPDAAVRWTLHQVLKRLVLEFD